MTCKSLLRRQWTLNGKAMHKVRFMPFKLFDLRKWIYAGGIVWIWSKYGNPYMYVGIFIVFLGSLSYFTSFWNFKHVFCCSIFLLRQYNIGSTYSSLFYVLYTNKYIFTLVKFINKWNMVCCEFTFLLFALSFGLVHFFALSNSNFSIPSFKKISLHIYLVGLLLDVWIQVVLWFSLGPLWLILHKNCKTSWLFNGFRDSAIVCSFFWFFRLVQGQ
jgi:hypothetical protein